MESLLEQWNRVVQHFGPQIIRILGAVGVLIVGWLVALAAGAGVRRTLHSTTLDNRLGGWVMGEEPTGRIEAERWAARIVYYLVLVFALVGFFTVLNLSVIGEPLRALLIRVFEYLPAAFGALVLAGVALLLATILRRIVHGAMEAAKIDDRLAGEVGLETGKRPALARTLSDAVYWLVLLLFLPAILEALSLQGLLAPVQSLLTRILTYLPNVLAALVIGGVGWFVARVLQRIVTSLLASTELDALGERLGIAEAMGPRKVSGAVGLLVYALVLLPVLIAALNALALEAVTRPASQMLSRILEAVPAILAAGLLLAIAYVVARLVANLVASLLESAGFNDLVVRLGLRRSAKAERSPAALVGSLVLIGVMLFAAIEAARLLGFASLATLLSDFVVVAGRVVLGLVVFGVGLYLAGVAAEAIRTSTSTQARLLATAARASIVVLAAAIALRQMGFANEIIELAFGVLLGSIAVAVALAFGLGSRDIAAREVEGWLRDLRSTREE
jgi:mechanosensitive ion channel-like protein